MTSLMRNVFAPHLDFTDLYGLLGNIVPSNLDMVIERKGHFLFAEWKRDGERLSQGQEILLKQLAKVPNHTVLIVHGHTDNGYMNVYKFWKISKGGGLSVKGDNVEDFKDYILNWFLDAEYNL